MRTSLCVVALSCVSSAVTFVACGSSDNVAAPGPVAGAASGGHAGSGGESKGGGGGESEGGGGGDGPILPEPCNAPQLLMDKCGGCHNDRALQSGLDLKSIGLESRIVGVVGEGCGEVLADPQDPTESGSLIIAKISGASTCGDRMPPAPLAPLSDDDLACIRDFISGARPPTPTTSCTPRAERKCELPAGVPDAWFSAAAAGSPCALAVQTCSADGELWMPDVCALGDYTWPRAGSECGSAADLNCNGVVESDCSKQWHTSISAPGTHSVNSVGIDGASNTYVLGEFSNYADFGTGVLASDEPGGQFKNDVFLAKYDELGKPVWSQKFGDTSNQYGTQLAVDTTTGDVAFIVRLFGGIHFGGSSPTYLQHGSSDFVVALMDTDGKHRWSQQFGSGGLDRAERIVFSRLDGDVIVGGKVSADEDEPLVIPTLGPIAPRGLEDGLVVKLDRTTGAVQWYYLLGGRALTDDSGNSFDDDYVFGVDTDAAGDVYVTGRFEGFFDFPKLVQDADTTEVASAGSHDIFVVKLDGTTGNPIWSKHFGGTGDDRAYDVAVQPTSGSVVVTGYFSGSADFGAAESLVAAGGAADDDIFVLSLDPSDGSTVFARRYGNAVSQFGAHHELGKTTRSLSLEVDVNDDIYVGGSLYGSWDGRITATNGAESKPDAFFVKLSPSGVYQSGRIYGGTGTEIGDGLALDPVNGTLALGGLFYGTSFNTGLGRLRGVSDDSDGFVLKINRP
ncbi:MAG TPA: PQQ-binding-like beta-propeller repeat protein [Polyangiaceae bacterium]|nr:PQQ-binding-like beta-propeller repeat protein [Polyangiaceae bacterium]